MFSLKYLLNPPYGFYEYVWLNVLLIRESPKAILIMFDGRKIWLPKAWIIKIKRPRHEQRSDDCPQRFVFERKQQGEAISIKISQYHWAKKVQ